MIRLVLFLLAVVAVATGLSWLADRPGNLVINWEGREVQTTVFHAVVMLAILIVVAIMAWSILRGLIHLPAGIGSFFNRRREKRGLEALSSGMIAIGAGDKSLATRYAVQARRSLPNEPLTHILRAQAAQLAGDRATARRIFEAMLSSPETEPLGLRGLYLEAEREGESEAMRQFAERALKLNPKLSWPVQSLFDLQCHQRDWVAALETLNIARKHGHVEKAQADRRRAVLLAAQAQACEDSDPERAMKLAEEAHTLSPDLVPATAIAGRLLAARGNVQKASKILQRGWRRGPHPDLATAYAYARIGDSPRDRLTRVKELAALSPHSIESAIAVATAAIESRDFDTARGVLAPLADGRLTQRICTLMARIESEDGGNTGAVREWLARAVNAPRDPVWTADGIIADDWAPVSPVTGALDAFQWRVPLENAVPRDAAILHEKIEELVKLGAPPAAAAAAAMATMTEEVAKEAEAIAPSVVAAPVAPAEPAASAQPIRRVAEAEVIEVVAAPGPASIVTPAPAAPKAVPAPVAEPASAPPAGPAAATGTAAALANRSAAAASAKPAAAAASGAAPTPLKAVGTSARDAAVSIRTPSDGTTGSTTDADTSPPQKARYGSH